jgi:hypothetical protein
MNYFDTSLQVRKVFTALEYCLGKDEPELRARVTQLIQRFTEEALESRAFLEASRAAVEVVFALDELSVPEVFLFKAVNANRQDGLWTEKFKGLKTAALVSSPVYASNETLWAPSIFMHPTNFRVHSTKFTK